MSIYVDYFKLVGIKQSLAPAWKELRKHLDIEEVGLNGTEYLGCTQTEFTPVKADIADKIAMYKQVFKVDDGINADLKAASGKKPAGAANKPCCAAGPGGRSVPACSNAGATDQHALIDNPDMSKVRGYEYVSQGFYVLVWKMLRNHWEVCFILEAGVYSAHPI